jgi:hypothetical protein
MGYKNTVSTSKGITYISATEPNRLMLRNICGFHGGYYEENRLPVYENPVHTSQESSHISAAEPNRLILCKI